MCQRADPATRSFIEETASQTPGVDADTLEAVWMTERGRDGGFNWDKYHTAYGPMQISSSVAKLYGVPGPYPDAPRSSYGRPGPTDAPAAQSKYNIPAAAKYLGSFSQRCNGSPSCMYGAYNAGHVGASLARTPVFNFANNYQC